MDIATRDADAKTDWLGASAAIASISAVGIAIGLSFPLLSIILDNRGYQAGLIGANAATAGVASLAAVWLVSPMANRLGVTWTLVLAALCASLSLILFFVFDSIAAWFVLRITFHGALTLSFVLSEFWINSASSENKRGLVLGIYATVLSLGFGIGPGILALTGSQTIMPFLIGSIIIAVSIVPIMVFSKRAPAIEGSLGSGSAFLRFVWIVPLATGAVFVFGAVEQSGLALFPVYGQRLGYSETAVSLLMIAIAAGNVALQIPLGVLSDRVNDRRHVLLGCAVVGAAGTALLPFVGTLPVVLSAVLFVWGGVISGLYTVGLAHLGSRLKGAELAQANSAFVLCYTVGMILGPQSAGLAMQAFDPHGFVWALFCFFTLYLVLYTVRSRWR